MNPPTNMPSSVDLPGYAVNALTARTHVGGTAPASMTETQIVSTIQTRATAADSFEFNDFVGGTTDVDVTCSNANKSCSGTVPDVDMLTFSLAGIEDLSLVDDTGLMDFDSDTEVVMVDRGVTIIQSQAAARDSDGTQLAFQTYGGWLTNSVFGVELLDVTEGATVTEHFASFSFGNDSESNPTGNGTLTWTGVMVGTDTRAGDVIHGDASVLYIIGAQIPLHQIQFNNVKSLNDGNDFRFSNDDGSDTSDSITYLEIPIMNGIFELESTRDGFLKGSFFGTSHEEVGGIFHHSTYNIIGAFGGMRQ